MNIRTPVLAPVPTPVIFDADNKTHRMLFARFLDTGRWPPGSPRFHVEMPFTSAVTTIQAKLVQRALRTELNKLANEKIETVEECPA